MEITNVQLIFRAYGENGSKQFISEDLGPKRNIPAKFRFICFIVIVILL